ncbi:ANK [Seminavis robusta]|uniref:ANK n=1 Tax=Seminavis robusta TaxID=568900 RepID=A0A9N8DJD9_9STRA|nr:ANK [Seminavis robusta]|eukprot:Sro154_g070090.1 ANK (365) ;mRNA; r:67431-68525
MGRDDAVSDDDGEDVAELEEMWKSMDRTEQHLNAALTEEEVQRHQQLDKKHRDHYWNTSKKTKGPLPSAAESLEYHESIPIRIRAIAPAERRLFLMEHTADDEFDRNNYWQILETASQDITTYPYAWVGIIMKQPNHMQESLYALRILLCYAENLLTNTRHKDTKKALGVLHISQKAVDVLGETMKDETGDERWELSLQEYKQCLYTALAFAALGDKEEAESHFQEAVSTEQLHRMMGLMECKDKGVHYDDDKTLETFVESHPSVLHVISKTLKIARRHLDDSHSFGEDLMDHLDEKKIGKCLEWFNVTASSNCSLPEEYCQVCWSTSPGCNLKKCARCKKVSYCGRECQINDWKDHKEVCGTV